MLSFPLCCTLATEECFGLRLLDAPPRLPLRDPRGLPRPCFTGGVGERFSARRGDLAESSLISGSDFPGGGERSSECGGSLVGESRDSTAEDIWSSVVLETVLSAGAIRSWFCVVFSGDAVEESAFVTAKWLLVSLHGGNDCCAYVELW